MADVSQLIWSLMFDIIQFMSSCFKFVNLIAYIGLRPLQGRWSKASPAEREVCTLRNLEDL